MFHCVHVLIKILEGSFTLDLKNGYVENLDIYIYKTKTLDLEDGDYLLSKDIIHDSKLWKIMENCEKPWTLQSNMCMLTKF